MQSLYLVPCPLLVWNRFLDDEKVLSAFGVSRAIQIVLTFIHHEDDLLKRVAKSICSVVHRWIALRSNVRDILAF